ncbi:MAG: chemotaxis response regulator protein-glutamate methylesterase [Planctomycetes bacterium]|nr:chemotaxis response regulator protein-glutamate methylesterase [Planctomycetota bacterium]
MRKIRVLIVDDAVVVRRMLSDVLASDPLIEVVGAAANGKIALAKIPQVNPDLLTLDVEMPEMDGLQTLAAVRKSYPCLPVIMFSTVTERGAVATLEALSLGATDYITKPANVGSVAAALERIREQLIPKVKLYCAQITGNIAVQVPKVKAAPRVALPERPSAPGVSRIDVVAIGVSTGGPNALAELMPSFPAGFPVPILIVQHMPPMFTRLLAERLASKSPLKVAEGVEGAPMKPGQAWVAPGDFHMALTRDALGPKIHLHQGPPENSCRPAVDVLFRSVAAIYGQSTLAVILTGMGQDGLRGCEAIAEKGGQILAQDEATSVVWGMPGFVVQAGLAQKVLPLGLIGPEIVRRVQKSRSAVAATSVNTTIAMAGS